MKTELDDSEDWTPGALGSRTHWTPLDRYPVRVLKDTGVSLRQGAPSGSP